MLKRRTLKLSLLVFSQHLSLKRLVKAELWKLGYQTSLVDYVPRDKKGVLHLCILDLDHSDLQSKIVLAGFTKFSRIPSIVAVPPDLVSHLKVRILKQLGYTITTKAQESCPSDVATSIANTIYPFAAQAESMLVNPDITQTYKPLIPRKEKTCNISTTS